MKPSSQKFMWCLFGVFCLTQLALAKEESAQDVCNKEKRRTLVAIKKLIGKCEGVVKGTPGQGPNCIAKCILEEEKALEPDGSITRDSFTHPVNKRTSGRQASRMLEAWDKCNELHGKEIKTDDPQCGGYLQFGMCLKDEIDTLCHDLTDNPIQAEVPLKIEDNEAKDEL